MGCDLIHDQTVAFENRPKTVMGRMRPVVNGRFVGRVQERDRDEEATAGPQHSDELTNGCFCVFDVFEDRSTEDRIE